MTSTINSGEQLLSNPDYHIEQFWLYFKKSMYNFYNQNDYKICRPIKLWSSQLNKLQKDKKYEDIEKSIRDYISLYAIDLMRVLNYYHLDILVTNIKRWNELTKKYNFTKTKSKYHNIIFLLLDICKSLRKKEYTEVFNIFSQIELFIIYNDFSSLIKYAIDMYNIKINETKLSGKKIFKLINVSKF